MVHKHKFVNWSQQFIIRYNFFRLIRIFVDVFFELSALEAWVCFSLLSENMPMPSCYECGAKLKPDCQKCSFCALDNSDPRKSNRIEDSSALLPDFGAPRLKKFKPSGPLAENSLLRRKKFIFGVLIFILVLVLSGAWLSNSSTGSRNSEIKSNKNVIDTLGGAWNIETNSGSVKCAGSMELVQDGLTFKGFGKDAAGTFAITGEGIPPNMVKFSKEYDLESRKRGAMPNLIKYEGILARGAGFNTLAGEYKAEKKVGFEHSQFNPIKLKHFTGNWTAQQINVGSSRSKSLLTNNYRPETQAVFRLFTLLGIVIVISAAVIVYLLFSPAGVLDKFEKNKYIPSQFKSQHQAILSQYVSVLEKGGWPLGTRLDWRWFLFWTKKNLNMPALARQKNPHMLIVGGAGQGKTRLIASLLTHDIKSNDRAVVVIDSDGELSRLVLNWINNRDDSEKVKERLILIDPAKTDSPAIRTFNPLQYPEDGDLQAASRAVVQGFKALYTEPPGTQSRWDAQTSNILRNAALLLTISGLTLADLPKLLQDNDFRDLLLNAVESKKSDKAEFIPLLETWNQYKKVARTEQWITWTEPILNRLGPILSDGRLSSILCGLQNHLELKDVIKEKKILLVRLPRGELGTSAGLLGSLLVTGLQQSAISLNRDSQINDFKAAIYLDQLENLLSKDTIEAITSESSRYNIGLIVSIRTLQTLPEDYRNSLINGSGALATFALSRKDAEMTGPQLFRVDGRKAKQVTVSQFFNPINMTRDYLYVSDEEKMNIDRIVGQEKQCFFFYRHGTIAGVFKLKAHNFDSVDKD